jgi:hypothetical protein
VISLVMKVGGVGSHLYKDVQQVFS